jgi:hypothetical protein
MIFNKTDENRFSKLTAYGVHACKLLNGAAAWVSLTWNRES